LGFGLSGGGGGGARFAAADAAAPIAAGDVGAYGGGGAALVGDPNDGGGGGGFLTKEPEGVRIGGGTPRPPKPTVDVGEARGEVFPEEADENVDGERVTPRVELPPEAARCACNNFEVETMRFVIPKPSIFSQASPRFSS